MRVAHSPWFVVRKSLALVVLLLALSLPAEAQQPAKVPRIGYLSGSGSAPSDAFAQGLRDLGYTEGKNITFEFQTAEGKIDRLAQLAIKLVGSAVDVILAADFNSAVAAKQATQTIPIVFQTLGDPVASGLVTALLGLARTSRVSPDLVRS